jgi:hypothetical protein
MNPARHLARFTHRITLAAGVALGWGALAFPPAPHQEVYGLVRDELGNPVTATGATVLLEANGTILASGTIGAGTEPGVNYRLLIPIDSGTTADLYKPSALVPTVPFRIRVKIGNVTYLPIEMSGASALVAQPGKSARVDLTLGVDSDGDGLPDAWELNLIKALGKPGLTLADIRPGDDADGDGLTNLQEYLAGTYAFDPQDGFALTLKGLDNGSAQLEFTIIRGRAYTIEGALTPQGPWTQIPFVIPADGASAPLRNSYAATDVRILKVTTTTPTDPATAPRFFRLMVH